jgi:hypothetical protein
MVPPSPEEFLKSFLQEMAAAYAEANVHLASIHTKYFGNPLLQDATALLLRDPSKAIIEEVKHSNGSATVITREPVSNYKTTPLRQRYHLSAGGGGGRSSEKINAASGAVAPVDVKGLNATDVTAKAGITL